MRKRYAWWTALPLALAPTIAVAQTTTPQPDQQPAAAPVETSAAPDDAEQVIERILEILLDIDTVRGTGRLYVP